MATPGRAQDVAAGSPGRLVREFHEAFGLPRAVEPRSIPGDLARTRQRLIEEEVRELAHAADAGRLDEIARELADVVYVAYGTALTYGIDLDAVLAVVHQANMSKLGADGRPVIVDGKVQKGPGFDPPDVASVLRRQEQARSFGTVADRYDRYRPTYAAEAVVWALGEPRLRVADVGAGTGILSRVLQRLGHEVIAIEPDDLMRERLVAVSPGITALAGTAEEIPLPDRSVDAVVAGQAYHWFDSARAHPEIARVLRPDGVFAAFWNDADLRAPWTVRLAEVIDGPEATRPRPAVNLGHHFGPVEQAEFRHEIWMTPEALLGLVMTRSPYLVAAPPGREKLVDAVRELLAGPELAGREQFPMPHVTRLHRATLR